MKKNIIAGIVFLIIQSLALFTYGLKDPTKYIWFCNFAPIILSIAFFIKQEQIVKAVINFGFFSQLIYLLGIAITFEKSIYFATTLIVHLSVFIAIFFTYKTKPKKEALLYSLILAVFVYFLTFFIVPESSPINHVRSVHLVAEYLPFITRFHTLYWIAFILLSILLTHYLQLKIYKYFSKKNK